MKFKKHLIFFNWMRKFNLTATLSLSLFFWVKYLFFISHSFFLVFHQMNYPFNHVIIEILIYCSIPYILKIIITKKIYNTTTKVSFHVTVSMSVIKNRCSTWCSDIFAINANYITSLTIIFIKPPLMLTLWSWFYKHCLWSN